MVWPDPVSLVIFLGVVIGVSVAVVVAITLAFEPGRRLRIGAIASASMLAWLGATGGLAASGIWQVERMFPLVAPYAFGCLFVAFAIGLSPVGKRLAEHTPIAALVGFHAFRIPLELVLHAWAEQGTVPHDISYLGQNFDIVPAVLALLVAPFAKRAPWLVLVFEVVGAAMLLNIIRIVGQNTPGSPLFTPHGEPPLLLAAYVPTTWIVSICVMFAIAGHVVIARWLWMRWR